MANEERDIQRKLKVLQHTEKIGNVGKACRYFGIGRSSFYRWRDAYKKHGEAGLKNAKDLLKENGTEIFGRFFIALIAQAAQERAVLPKSKRLPAYVYVDEASDYFDKNVDHPVTSPKI